MVALIQLLLTMAWPMFDPGSFCTCVTLDSWTATVGGLSFRSRSLVWFPGKVSVKLLKTGRIRIDHLDHSQGRHSNPRFLYSWLSHRRPIDFLAFLGSHQSNGRFLYQLRRVGTFDANPCFHRRRNSVKKSKASLKRIERRTSRRERSSLVACVGPTTPKPVGPRWRRSIRPK